MARLIDEFCRMLAEKVPLILDISVRLLDKESYGIHLWCVEGIALQHVYVERYLESTPFAVLCEDVARHIERAFYEKRAEAWQAMKTDGHGIALCTLGAWTMQRRIAWPPPNTFRIPLAQSLTQCTDDPLPLMSPATEELWLLHVNDLTRVAQYGRP